LAVIRDRVAALRDAFGGVSRERYPNEIPGSVAMSLELALVHKDGVFTNA